MELLNLTAAQFLALFGAVAAISVALYLLDRSRRKQVVSTLRFWIASGQPAAVSRKRRIQQPWSLLLQLLGMALLLLALAEFQFGGAAGRTRAHVLVLDTSAGMGASVSASNTLMDVARANALGWLRAVPAADPVLLVRADALATPATAWETDHRKVARGILESQPGATALNLSQNLEFARELQRQRTSTPGEIVYVGPGFISAREANNLALPPLPAFRVLDTNTPIENVGLRSAGARRSETTPGAWDILVRARNYGRTPRVVNVTLNFGKAPQGMRQLELQPGIEKETTFTVRTQAAGLIEARLYPRDSFAPDNYASLELPSQRALHVFVYSDQPELIRPALASDPRVNAEFRDKAQYSPSSDGLILLDRFQPPSQPKGNVLWIDPPAASSPVPVRERVEKPEDLQWLPDRALTAGLRARGSQIGSASVFQTTAADIKVARVAQGPVIVARPGTVVIGFNPFAGPMRYELATPLLLANVLRFVAPDVFRDVDIATQSAGVVASPLNAATVDAKNIQVLTSAGVSLPFNVRDRAIQFFAGEPERVRVIAGNSERVYSLTLPELGDTKWNAPSNARKGIPLLSDSVRRNRIVWPFLALSGAVLLIVDWLLFGSFQSARLRAVSA